MSLRSQSTSPTGGASSSFPPASQDKKTDTGMIAVFKTTKESPEGLLKPKKSKSPDPTQEAAVGQESITSDIETSGVCIKVEKHTMPPEQAEKSSSVRQDCFGVTTDLSQDTQPKSVETESKEVEEAVRAIPKELDMQAVMNVSAVTMTQEGKRSSTLDDSVQGSQEVWETVIDSGCSSAKVNLGSVDTQNHLIKCEASAVDNISVSIDKDGKKIGGNRDEMNSHEAKSSQDTESTIRSLTELGIEVENISENEEEIDPGKGTE